MLSNLNYRLALDLGTTSIGWCLLKLNKLHEPVAIIRMGSRIFSDGRHPKDGSSLAVARREARQMRRRRDRLLKRKQAMTHALIDLGFFPQDEDQRQALTQLNPYQLRKKGLYEELSGAEFARALFHINQRRGFLSNRKTDSKDSESGLLKKSIKTLRDKLEQENCQTLGEWLANRHEQRLSVRARLRGATQKDKAYDFYADRAMVAHEFETLWQKQRQYKPELFTQAAHDKLQDILLFQRPLKPARPGRCTLLPEEERAPLALPSVQQFRIYQEINNLRILNDLQAEKTLTMEQRDIISDLLAQKRDVSFTEIIKKLGQPGSARFNLQDIKRTSLKGNITNIQLSNKNAFGKEWYRFSLEQQDEIVTQLLDEPSISTLCDWLQKYTNIDPEQAQQIADISLSSGYSHLSSKAINKVLPELKKDVIPFSAAVTKAGLGSHSALSHADQTGEIMDRLPYYGIPLSRHVGFAKENPRNEEERYGKIANPTVHIGLNELRKVVNALINKYGHPQEVIIEVTRDLKLSHSKKLELQKEQAQRQKQNQQYIEDACKVLQLNPDNLSKSQRREISQKIQLWIELNPNASDRCCPYSGEQISIQKLLSNEVEIEHILPFSMTLDDSMNNKTVSMRHANRDKGNRSPYDAFGNSNHYDYEAILARTTRMPRAKRKKFAPDALQHWQDEEQGFIARALNDTAYFSRIAREYLTLICPPNKVHAIPGRLTAMLRGKYGLNKLLSGTELKNRNDHRHHALDAAVIGITDRSLLQKVSTASAHARELHLNRLIDDLPEPWPKYRQQVENALKAIIVSHKPEHSFEGAIFEATAYGIRRDGSVVQKNNPDKEKQRVIDYVVPIYAPEKSDRHGTRDDGSPRAYKGYQPGGNYCLEIIQAPEGHWQMETIPIFRAYEYARQLGWGRLDTNQILPNIIRDKLSDKPGELLMKLMPGDTIRMNYKGQRNMLLSVVQMSVKGGATFTPIHEANIQQRYTNKLKANKALKQADNNESLLNDLDQSALNDTFIRSQIGIAELQAGNAQKVTVSPIGTLNQGYRRKS